MKTNDVPSVTVSDDQLMLEAIDARIAGHQTAITVLTERRETLVRALTSGSANQPKVKPKGKKRGPVSRPVMQLALSTALARKGVCRHRARACFVTAAALGVSTSTAGTCSMTLK